MTGHPPFARSGAVARGVGALVALTALVIGVPVGLAHAVGWPLPHSLPSAGAMRAALTTRGISDRVLLDTLACVAWLAWASAFASVAAEVIAVAAGRASRRLRWAETFQPVAGRLVAAVLFAILTLTRGEVTSTTPTRLSLASRLQPASITLDAPVASTTPSPYGPHPAPSVQVATSPATATTAAPPATVPYTVVRHDTLWSIAQTRLGDPLLWKEIFALNEGRPQPDGRTLTDPHWIYPGWTLILPPVTPASVPVPIAPTSPATGPTTTTPTSPPAEPHSATSAPAPRAPLPTSRAAAPIRLPSGSIIAGSFATGVLSALAAGRLRRRRHYRPQPPRPGHHLDQPARSAGLRDLLVTVHTTRNEDDELTSSTPTPPTPMIAIPEDDALLHPDMIEVARHDHDTVRLGLCDWPGLALGGPGAESALRAWLASLLTRNGPYGAEILVTCRLGDRLFPGLGLPGLRRVDTTETALIHLETAMVGRTRRLDDAGVPDAAAHRRQSPEYPFPLLLVATEVVPEALDACWRAILATATRLGLAALVLSPEHEANESPTTDADPRLVVGKDGSLQQVTPRSLADRLEGGWLFQLSVADGVDLLAPVAAIHNDHQFDEADRCDDPHDDGAAVTIRSNGARSSVKTADALAVSWPPSSRHVPEWAPIRVRVLGPARVEAWGDEITSGLRSSAYELLAWYALRPDGATAEAAIDALWPDASPQRGRERFWTALGNLRSRLHDPNNESVEILTKVGEHYRPDPTVLDLDLWRFENALSDAARANEAVDVIAALEVAAATYGGDFYPSANALWVEPAREDLHRRALDAQLRLAELRADDGRPDAAIAALERAIEIDPICEDAYRRLMTLQARFGRDDAAQRTWRLLQGRLAELDLEPETTTTDLVHEILTARPIPTGRRLQVRR
ncbi:MAG TPA: BTAD domain-containing putative transcriptional regulator [Acidimicrobiales bacterium]|nr:BTAD domain-containing putative transcriptional regulator [Acidimicrobiales bacterium]